jgi:hypothetical protein
MSYGSFLDQRRNLRLVTLRVAGHCVTDDLQYIRSYLHLAYSSLDVSFSLLREVLALLILLFSCLHRLLLHSTFLTLETF